MGEIHRLPDIGKTEREAADWFARLNADDGGHGQVPASTGQLLEQLGVAIERDHADAGPGEVERDPTGARADVEHGAPGRRGELAPQR